MPFSSSGPVAPSDIRLPWHSGIAGRQRRDGTDTSIGLVPQIIGRTIGNRDLNWQVGRNGGHSHLDCYICCVVLDTGMAFTTNGCFNMS